MKSLVYLIGLVLLSSVAFAQTTGLMGYDRGGSGMDMIIGLVYFAVGAFIFSAIFWLTHNWLAKNKK
jgi:hypothetical protein